MVTKTLLFKALLSVALCFGASHPNMAQRTAPEPPLTAVQPRLQQPVPVVELLAKDKDTTMATAPPATVMRIARSWPQPLYLLNSEVIIGPDLLRIQPAEIKKLMVYKGQDAPARWRGLVTYGIIDVTLRQKTRLRSRTLAAVGKVLGVSGPVRYTINAMPVTDAGLRIALDAIGEIKITRATPEVPTATVAISVRPPKPTPPRNDPPGTIYIRGVAAY